jgi:hypothetical protein
MVTTVGAGRSRPPVATGRAGCGPGRGSALGGGRWRPARRSSARPWAASGGSWPGRPGWRPCGGCHKFRLVRMQVHRLAVLGAGAALTQRTRAAAPVEHRPTARSDGHVVAGRAGDRAGMKVDREVVFGEAARHRWPQRDRFDRLGVAGGRERRAGLAATVGGVGQHLEPWPLPVKQRHPDGPSAALAGVSAAAVTRPVSGSAARWAL